jgi:peptide/nickel transport system ATP-binding protein
MSEILRVENLKKYFKSPRGMVHAVDEVYFSLEKGKTLGVVGESGCGKTTLGRTLVGLTEPTDGSIVFEGIEITSAGRKQRHELHKEMQIIFQDPFSSLNPRYCVRELIADPLRTYGVYKNKRDLDKRIDGLMDTVGLAKRLSYSYPHELDGGRRQRIGVARALALDPKFIVCDEPVSALDVSIQAQILNLLQDLQEEKGLTFVFITHDLSVVKHISDEIMVMYLGNVIEKCPKDALFEKHLHPYTKGLMSAIPVPNIHLERKRVIMQGELTSPIDPKPGCRFANRCPYVKEKCRCDSPVLEEALPGHFAACHYVREINGLGA